MSTEQPDGSLVTNLYDCDSHRVERDDGVDVARYVYDGNNVLVQTDGLGVTEAAYTLNPQPYGQVVSQYDAADGSRFHHFDGRHDTGALSDATEVVTDDYLYDAFGKVLQGDPSTTPLLYKGQLGYWHDADLGTGERTYQAHHRIVTDSRFLSEDPAGKDLNTYRHARNNPVNESDPSGLDVPWTEEMLRQEALLAARHADQAAASQHSADRLRFIRALKEVRLAQFRSEAAQMDARAALIRTQARQSGVPDDFVPRDTIPALSLPGATPGLDVGPALRRLPGEIEFLTERIEALEADAANLRKFAAESRTRVAQNRPHRPPSSTSGQRSVDLHERILDNTGQLTIGSMIGSRSSTMDPSQRTREIRRHAQYNRDLDVLDMRLGQLQSGMRATLGTIQTGSAVIIAIQAAPVTGLGAAYVYGLAGLDALRGADLTVAATKDVLNPEEYHRTGLNAIGAHLTGDQATANQIETAFDVTLMVVNLGEGVYRLTTFRGGRLVSSTDVKGASHLADEVETAATSESKAASSIDEATATSQGAGRAARTAESVAPTKVVDSIPSVRNGEFNRWFNNLSADELDEIWKNPKLRDAIEDRLRHPGGLHEWHLVSRTPTFKRWGLTADQIKDMRSLIEDTNFVNPVGRHGGKGSTVAHNELLGIIDSSLNYETFVRRLQTWAHYRLKGGASALPPGLRP